VTDPLINYCYTVHEIERMRAALDAVMFPTVWLSRTSGHRPGTGGRPGELEEKIERQLRTYMLNGTRLKELEALAQQREEQSERARLQFEER
jgi:hypothetical protein